MDDRTLILVNVVVSLLAVAAAVVAAWFARGGSAAGDAGREVAELTEQSRALKTMMEGLERTMRQEASSGRTEAATSAKDLREEVARTLSGMLSQMRETLDQLGKLQQSGLEGFGGRLASSVTELKGDVGTTLRTAGETQSKSIEAMKVDQRAATAEFRESVQNALIAMTGEQTRRFEDFSKRIGELTLQQERAAQDLRNTVMGQLGAIQKDNEAKLDQIRITVDEKLNSTLNQRLGESFKQVSEQLNNLHAGLGQMQALSAGVTDLKRVMTNVKSRGTWGEFQLANLLSQVLTPDQYVANFRCNEKSQELVEFAVRLPGKSDDGNDPVWVPIDSKFPTADYERLIAASEAADAEEVARAANALEKRVYDQAKSISTKYLNPPRTTDWGILFLPTEGLYAEVLRRPGVVETLHNECRVMVAGPTTLAVMLNAFQMGFRTMAIQKKSGEVWKTLGAVKSQFVMFRELLDKAKKNLEKASGDLDDASHRTKQIEKKLRKAEELPVGEAERLLLPAVDDVE